MVTKLDLLFVVGVTAAAVVHDFDQKFESFFVVVSLWEK